MTVQIINPANKLPLSVQGDCLADSSGASFRIVSGIPRIASPGNYTDNFGLQWNKFARTQIDRAQDSQTLSQERFFAETGWQPETLAGLNILEVGSGAGRFSRVVLEKTQANLYSVDYSDAVSANQKNNQDVAHGRLHLFQASIYELPFPPASFDKVFCMGVLQHTPDFEQSVKALIDMVKPGGELVVDFYPVKGFWSKINAKYLLRPFTRNMSHDRLLKLIDRNIDGLIRAYFLLHRCGLGVFARFLPLCDLNVVCPPGLTPAQMREWAVLDTFDMYSPTFDQPQRVSTVARMFQKHGARVSYAGFVRFCGKKQAAVVRGHKPA